MTTVLDRPLTISASDGDLYFQCQLRRGDERTTGWIEKRGAKIGARVEIKDDDGGYWRVLAVYHPPRSITWLRDKQRKDRGGLKSIK